MNALRFPKNILLQFNTKIQNAEVGNYIIINYNYNHIIHIIIKVYIYIYFTNKQFDQFKYYNVIKTKKVLVLIVIRNNI